MGNIETREKRDRCQTWQQSDSNLLTLNEDKVDFRKQQLHQRDNTSTTLLTTSSFGSSIPAEDTNSPYDRTGTENEKETDECQMPALCMGSWFPLIKKNKAKDQPLLTCVDEDENTSNSSNDYSLEKPKCRHRRDAQDSSAAAFVAHLHVQGETLERQAHYKEAIQVYQQLLKMDSLCNIDRSTSKSGSLYYRIGILQWKLGLYDESLISLDLAVDEYEQQQLAITAKEGVSLLPSVAQTAILLNDDIAEAYIAAGKVHLSRGRSHTCKKCLKQALKLLDDTSLMESQSTCFQRTSHVFAKAMHAMAMASEANGHYRNALEHCQVALSMQRTYVRSDDARSSNDVAKTLLTFGSIHSKIGMYEFALNCFTEAYNTFQECSAQLETVSVDMGVALVQMGGVHYLMGNNDKTIEDYNKALHLYASIGAVRNIELVSIQIGMVHMQMACRNGNQNAVQLSQSVLNSSSAGQSLLSKSQSASSLMDAAVENIGKLDKAVEFLDRALKMRFKDLGQENLEIGDSLMRLGSVYANILSQRGAAFQCYVDALHIYRSNKLDAQDPRLVEAKAALRGEHQKSDSPKAGMVRSTSMPRAQPNNVPNHRFSTMTCA